MKALLRFQAVVAAKSLGDRALLSTVGVPLLLLFVLKWGLHSDDSTVSIAGITFAALICVGVLAATFDALDAVRWRAPVGRSRVLAAHFLFSATVFAPPLAAVAVVRSGDRAESISLVCASMLVAWAAAAVVPVFQSWRRNVTFDSAVRFIVLSFVVIGLGTWSAILAVLGRSALALVPSGMAFSVAVAACCRSHFHEERLPVASGPDDPREVAPARRTPRAPTASLRAGLPNRGMLITSAVVALAMQLLPSRGSSPPVPQLLLLGAALSIGSASLSSCRWLFAGPMDRGRLFRRCFVPVIALIGAGVTVGSLVEELRPDRSVFFDTFRPNMTGTRHRDALVLGQVLAVDENGYRPPDIPFMAERVREHLWTNYRLDLTREEVETPIRRGWPASGRNSGDTSPSSQDAVFDAMDRVHDDLAEEIVAADRRRIVVNACGMILICLVMLRVQLLGFRRIWATTAVWLVGCAAFFAPLLAPTSSFAGAVTDAWHSVFALVRDTPAQFTSLGFVALAVILWKSSERAFRRLDITDLPPATMAEWRQSRSA